MLITTGQSPGSAIGLNLQTPLYVGGVDQSSVRLSPDVGVERGFAGCISQVMPLLTYTFQSLNPSSDSSPLLYCLE